MQIFTSLLVCTHHYSYRPLIFQWISDPVLKQMTGKNQVFLVNQKPTVWFLNIWLLWTSAFSESIKKTHKLRRNISWSHLIVYMSANYSQVCSQNEMWQDVKKPWKWMARKHFFRFSCLIRPVFDSQTSESYEQNNKSYFELMYQISV